MNNTKTKRQIGLLAGILFTGALFGYSNQVVLGVENTNASNGNTNTNAAVNAGTNTNVSNANADSTVSATATNSDPASDLQAQIEASKQKLSDLQKQAQSYQQLVDQSQGVVQDIKSQVSLIDAQVAQTSFAIQAKQQEITTLQLEIDSLQQQIDEKTQSMNDQKAHLADAIKQLDASSRTPTLALVLTRRTLADYYSQSEAVASIGKALEKSLDELSRLKMDLQAKQDDVTKTKDNLQQAKLQLEVQQQSTQQQKDLKVQLLSNAQVSTGEYQDQLQQALSAEQQVDATINALEKQMQDAQRGASGQSSVPAVSANGFIWPANGTISAYFHDPTYPFRCTTAWGKRNPGSCMEHPAIDISIPQGTPIRAAADGAVSAASFFECYTAKNSQGAAYTVCPLNAVGIVHGPDLSSRYLHLTKIYVHVGELVHQGDIIGLSGGLPGTTGSGGMTTGPHLHFEIRVAGIPDDPLKYLPK